MNWTTATIGEVTKVLNGTTPRTSNPAYWGGSNIWITPKDLGKLDSWVIRMSDRFITDEGVESCNLSLVPAGSIVMSSRAPIGHLAIAGCDLYTNQGCKSLMCSANLDPKFLFFTLMFRMPDIQAIGSGATFVEISKSALEAFDIKFPNIVTQRQIATRLKAQLAEVEKARQAAKAQLTEISTLLDFVIEKEINEALSKEFKNVILGDVVYISAKLVDPTLPEIKNLLHVSAENITTITGEFINLKSAAEDGMKSNKYLFESGDVLYSKLRPYLRKVALPDFCGLCSADMYPLKAKSDHIEPEFLQILLSSKLFTEYANEKSARSRMPKLNRKQLFSWEFRLPVLKRQKACVENVSRILEQLKDAEKAIKKINAEISILPSKLLSQAFEMK